VSILVEDFAAPGAGLDAALDTAPGLAPDAALKALEFGEELELEALELREELALEALEGAKGLFNGAAPEGGPPVDSGVGGCKAAEEAAAAEAAAASLAAVVAAEFAEELASD